MDELRKILFGAVSGARRRLQPDQQMQLPLECEEQYSQVLRHTRSVVEMTPVDQLIDAETTERRLRIVYGHLNELAGERDEYLQLLKLRLMEGQSFRPLSQLLNIKCSTVRSVAIRAEKRLELARGWRH